MELYLLNTSEGLKPMYDADYEEKKKLKKGHTYKAKITLARNIDFHRKYFKLINLAWDYQNESVVEFFKHSVESFRKSVEMAAGFYDTIFSIARKEWIEIPRSIAFDKMDEFEFGELYENVKRVLFQVFLKDISEEEFNNVLKDF